MSISLQTVFAADAHLAERQVLREEPTENRGKSPKFLVETQMSKLSSKEGKDLYPL
jgi:hypothetical protein